MKRKTGFLAVLFLCLGFLLPANCRAEDRRFVYDVFGVLSGEERRILEEELSQIYEEYDFEAVILTQGDIGWEDGREYAARFMQQFGIGEETSYNAMCLFHQPGERSVSLVFRGKAQYAFNDAIQDLMLDDLAEGLSGGDVCEAYMSLLDMLRGGLARFHNGKTIRPMDVQRGSFAAYILQWLLISFAVMAVPTLILTIFQKNRMKTVVPQLDANCYIPEDGFVLREKDDIFMHTHTIRTPIPRADHPGRGGGLSGGFSVGGEHFSGSSRKY